MTPQTQRRMFVGICLLGDFAADGEKYRRCAHRAHGSENGRIGIETCERETSPENKKSIRLEFPTATFLFTFWSEKLSVNIFSIEFWIPCQQSSGDWIP